jgi:hypothetical protein
MESSAVEPTIKTLMFFNSGFRVANTLTNKQPLAPALSPFGGEREKAAFSLWPN